MQRFILALFFLVSSLGFGQAIEKQWQFSSIENEQGESLFDINPDSDVLTFNDGTFHYSLEAKDSLMASGDYILQNNLLVFFYTQPTDTIRRYRISTLTDSTLVFSENNISYKFTQSTRTVVIEELEDSSTSEDSLIPSQGFSMNSLWRGVLGMLTLIFIAYLFSANRRAINWRTVGIGLTFQLIIAVGVLKV